MPRDVAALSEQLLYPLWDAGFTVGHAVRTPGECRRAGDGPARCGDRDAGRPAAGRRRRPAGRSARGPVLARLRSDVDGFAERLANDARDRRKRFGSAAYLLEPELKEGGGGLRDIHAFGWLQEVRAGRSRTTVCSGPPSESSWTRREEFLTRVRSAMHLESGRADRSAAPGSAARHRERDGVPGRAAADRGGRLDAGDLRTRAGRGCAHRGRDRPRPPPGGSRIRSSSCTPRTRSRWSPEPRRRDGRSRRPSSTPSRSSPAGRRSSGTTRCATRSCGSSARERGPTDGLQALDRTGLLARLIPEWVDVRCRPQRDPYHRYTVDVHLLRAFDRMSRALAEPDARRSAGGRGGGSHRGPGRRAPGGAPARHRQERRGRSRGGRRPRRRPRSSPAWTSRRRRASSRGSWWPSISCCPTRRPDAISATTT